MTGKQIDDLGNLAGIYEIGKYDDWNLRMTMVNTETGEVWPGGLDDFTEEGMYALVRLDK